MGELVQPPQVVAAFLGAVLALSGQYVWRRLSQARTAKALSAAFWEELSATAFYVSQSANLPGPAIGGFSSQTFDTLFAEMASCLPSSLARDLMRYHWRTKYLWELQNLHPLGTVQVQYDEAKELREKLLGRLAGYEGRWTAGLAIWRRELR